MIDWWKNRKDKTPHHDFLEMDININNDNNGEYCIGLSLSSFHGGIDNHR
jgi:hypothetical protein